MIQGNILITFDDILSFNFLTNLKVQINNNTPYNYKLWNSINKVFTLPVYENDIVNIEIVSPQLFISSSIKRYDYTSQNINNNSGINVVDIVTNIGFGILTYNFTVNPIPKRYKFEYRIDTANLIPPGGTNLMDADDIVLMDADGIILKDII
jgi:hypothetical protein